MATPATRLDPEQRDALHVLGHFMLSLARPDRAAIVYRALDLLEPGHAPHLRALAVACARAGQSAEALEALERLALAGALDGDFLALRARVLAALGRQEEARAAMRAALGASAGRGLRS